MSEEFFESHLEYDETSSQDRWFGVDTGAARDMFEPSEDVFESDYEHLDIESEENWFNADVVPEPALSEKFSFGQVLTKLRLNELVADQKNWRLFGVFSAGVFVFASIVVVATPGEIANFNTEVAEPEKPPSAVNLKPSTVDDRLNALDAEQNILEPELSVSAIVPTPAPGSAKCEGVSTALQAPASDLASRIAKGEFGAGTCFRLAAGTYYFHDVVPVNNMKFIGDSAASVIVNGTHTNGKTYENAFHGVASGVTIANITFKNFKSPGKDPADKPQEQAPIRGTKDVWASIRGQVAKNWVIDSIVSEHNYAAGVFIGDNFIVRNSTLRYNGTTGLAGDEISGGDIHNNIVHNNGQSGAAGVYENNAGIKVTQAGTSGSPIKIRDNEVYDNEVSGIWGDIACDGFEVTNNTIRNHPNNGIVVELCNGATISGNTIINTGSVGIVIAESANVDIMNNTIDRAVTGVQIRQRDTRGKGSEAFLSRYKNVNYVSKNIRVENNIMKNVKNNKPNGDTLGTIRPNTNITYANNRLG